MITQVDPFNTVVLSGAGGGQCKIEPPHGARWQLRLANVSTNGTTNQPTCILYRGSSSGPLQQIDSTNTGNSASSQNVAAAPFFAGQALWAVWTGGDAGATATLQAYGEQRGRADGPFEPAPIGAGFQSIPTSLIAGIPGGARVVIGSDVPAVVRTYYTTNYAGSVVNAAWIGMYIDNNNFFWTVTGTLPTGPFLGYGDVIGGVAHEFYNDTQQGTQFQRSYGFIDNAVLFMKHVTLGLTIDPANSATEDFTINSIGQPWGIRGASRGTSTTALTTTAATELDLPFAKLPAIVCNANRINEFEFDFHVSQTVSTDVFQIRLRRDTAVTGTLLFGGSFNVSLSATTERLSVKCVVRSLTTETVDFFFSVVRVAGTGTCSIIPRPAGANDNSSFSKVTDNGWYGVTASVWVDR